jgi:hypothetical protein
MKPRTLVLLLAVAIVGAACGSSALSTAEYSAAIEEATDVYIVEAQGLSTEFQRTVEEEVAALAASGEGDLLTQATDLTSQQTIQYLALLEDAMSRYSTVLGSIEPPPVLAEPHDDYLEAIESVRLSMPATRDAVGQARDLTGIQTAITSSGFGDGQLRLQVACARLAAAVRAEGQGVDLGCTRSPVVDG